MLGRSAHGDALLAKNGARGGLKKHKRHTTVQTPPNLPRSGEEYIYADASFIQFYEYLFCRFVFFAYFCSGNHFMTEVMTAVQLNAMNDPTLMTKEEFFQMIDEAKKGPSKRFESVEELDRYISRGR